jgi:NADPH2:quinone reductase
LTRRLLKGAFIGGGFCGDFARRDPQANAQMMQTLATMYGKGQIKPVIDQTLPMSELHQAYAIMGSRSVKGKLVMVNP